MRLLPFSLTLRSPGFNPGRIEGRAQTLRAPAAARGGPEPAPRADSPSPRFPSRGGGGASSRKRPPRYGPLDMALTRLLGMRPLGTARWRAYSG